MRAPCSDAIDSSSARKICVSIKRVITGGRLCGRLFVNVVFVLWVDRSRFRFGFGNRQKLFSDNALRQHGFELGKNQKDFVERFVFGETLDDVVRDLESFFKFDAAFAVSPMYSETMLPRRRKKSRPLRPTVIHSICLPGFSLTKACAL
jgi:hypothetical protein